MTQFKVGDIVTLSAETIKRRRIKEDVGLAQIVTFYKDVEGGVALSRDLDGFCSWNVKDLASAQTQKPAPPP